MEMLDPVGQMDGGEGVVVEPRAGRGRVGSKGLLSGEDTTHGSALHLRPDQSEIMNYSSCYIHCTKMECTDHYKRSPSFKKFCIYNKVMHGSRQASDS